MKETETAFRLKVTARFAIHTTMTFAFTNLIIFAVYIKTPLDHPDASGEEASFT